MSRSNKGRKVELFGILKGGTEINSECSVQLLQCLFLALTT